MYRRRYLGTIGGCVGAASLSGCTAVLPGADQEPEYPGGTLLIENTGDRPVRVSIETKLDQYDASLDIDVAGGEMIVRRDFGHCRSGRHCHA